MRRSITSAESLRLEPRGLSAVVDALHRGRRASGRALATTAALPSRPHLVADLALVRIEPLVLEEEHGVVVADGRLQQRFRIAGVDGATILSPGRP